MREVEKNATLDSCEVTRKPILFPSLDFSFLGAVFFVLWRLTPLHVMSIIVLCVLSQICLLLTLILPWKLVVLLYANRMPLGVPNVLEGLEPENQVVVVGVAILVSLMLYLIFDMMAGWVCRKGGDRIISINNKIGLFNNHKEYSNNLYSHLSKSMSAIAFCFLVMAWLVMFYPLLIVSLVSYSGLWMIAFSIFVTPYSGRVRKVRKALPLVYKLWWHIGFIYAVAWVVTDYWIGGAPELLILFVSLLLIRQGLIHTVMLIQRLSIVYKQKAKVMMLFMPDVSWQNKKDKVTDDDGLRKLLLPDKKKDIVQKVTHYYPELFVDNLDVRAQVFESEKMVTLMIKNSHDADSAKSASLICKVYDRSRESIAEQEGSVLSCSRPYWPAPDFVDQQTIRGFSCLLLGFYDDMHWAKGAERKNSLISLRARLIFCDLDSELIQRYRRSHLSLKDRLQGVDWNFLVSLADSKESESECKKVSECWTEVINQLDALPYQLVLPRLGKRRLLISREGKLALCDWSRWRWEPVGASWPLDKLDELEDAVRVAARHRPELNNVSLDMLKWSARLYEFDRRYYRKDYAGGISMVKGILRQHFC